jgi:hypothetical protein
VDRLYKTFRVHCNFYTLQRSNRVHPVQSDISRLNCFSHKSIIYMYAIEMPTLVGLFLSKKKRRRKKKLICVKYTKNMHCKKLFLLLIFGNLFCNRIHVYDTFMWKATFYYEGKLGHIKLAYPLPQLSIEVPVPSSICV